MSFDLGRFYCGRNCFCTLLVEVSSNYLLLTRTSEAGRLESTECQVGIYRILYLSLCNADLKTFHWNSKPVYLFFPLLVDDGDSNCIYSTFNKLHPVPFITLETRKIFIMKNVFLNKQTAQVLSAIEGICCRFHCNFLLL